MLLVQVGALQLFDIVDHLVDHILALADVCFALGFAAAHIVEQHLYQLLFLFEMLVKCLLRNVQLAANIVYRNAAQTVFQKEFRGCFYYLFLHFHSGWRYKIATSFSVSMPTGFLVFRKHWKIKKFSSFHIFYKCEYKNCAKLLPMRF